MLFRSLLLALIVYSSLSPAAPSGRGGKPLASSTGFQFPNPEVPLPKVPTNTQEKYEAARYWTAQYTQQFIQQFLVMNGLKENLFNIREILHGAYREVDNIPAADLDNPQKVVERVNNYRSALIALADKLYAKERPNATVFSGGNRLDAIERRLSELQSLNAQMNDFAKKLDSFGQRLTMVEQRKLPVALPSVSNATDDGRSGKIAFAALILAAGSFFFQLYGRRK